MKLPRPSESIQTRLILILVALAGLPLLLVGIVLGWRSFNVQEQQALTLQRQTAQRIGVAVKAFFEEVEGQLRIVSRTQGLQSLDAEKQRTVLDEIFFYNDIFENLSLLDSQGQERIHISRMDPSPTLEDRSGSDEFLLPQTSGKTYYGPVRIEEASKEPLMIIAIPLENVRTGLTDGVLVAELRVKRIWELIAELRVSPGQSVYIVDARSEVIAHRDPTVALSHTTFNVPSEDGAYPGLDSERVILATDKIRLGEQELNIVAQQEWSEALNLANTTITLIVILIVPAMLTAGISGFFAMRQIVRPIKSLSITSQAIAEGNLNQNIAYQAPDEVGRLADAFRHMISYLQTMSAAADRLALGDITAQVIPQSSEDALGNAFQRMIGYQQAMASAANHLALGDITVSITPQSEEDALGSAFQRMVNYQQAMAAAADRLALGDITAEVAPQSEEDALGNAFRRMIGYQQEMAAAADRLAVGDITAEVTPQSEQDALGNAFAQMITNLRDLIGEVAQGANSLGSAAEQMAVTASQVALAINQVASAINEMARGTAQQIDGVSQTVNFVIQMSEAIEGVARGAQEQAIAVNKSAEITHQMTLAIEKVASGAMESAQGSIQATELSRAGAETVTKTIKGMENIKTKVGNSAQKVEEMGQHSEQIGIIVETIDDIASQTNLLSLNAAIEASRAGEHGKGFAVVADEIRRLATKSAEATKEISRLVRNVQKTVTQTVQAMNEGVNEVTMGVGLANEAGQAIRDALMATEKVNRQMENIAVAAQQMDSSASGLVNAMNSVSAVVEENTAATEEMAANSDEMAQMTRNIASISEENSASAEQIAATVEEVSAQVEEVAASVQSINQMARTLNDLVGRFILPE
ncbi:MAG: HAMP domain-containing protein [Anaerolineae bacterium]|nr:HAMP domain-containing protein [Anaerolineae bacterium]